jgi:ATP-dependent protease ClpP protease subunit/protein-arginine kinase activator protein McsA
MNEILMYGEIGKDITDTQFNKDLNAFKGQDVLLRANSPGGEVFQGLAMYNSIKDHGQCDIQIDGLAASMMTIIMLAARKISMAKNALIMIHLPSDGSDSADRSHKDKEILSKVTDIALSSYSERTGISSEEILKMLEAETWMTATEALEKGFIDEITDDVLEQTAPIATMKNKKPKAVYMTFKKGIVKMESLCKILGLAETSETEIILKAISTMKNKQVSTEAELRRIKNQIKTDQTSEAKRLTALAIECGVINKNLESVHLLAFEQNFKKTKSDLESAINEVQGNAVTMHNQKLIREVVLKGKSSNKDEKLPENLSDKPKSEWTLNDYRKYAPKELENDKELYKKLVDKEFKKK